jgi:hypothetical protein
MALPYGLTRESWDAMSAIEMLAAAAPRVAQGGVHLPKDVTPVDKKVFIGEFVVPLAKTVANAMPKHATSVIALVDAWLDGRAAPGAVHQAAIGAWVDGHMRYKEDFRLDPSRRFFKGTGSLGPGELAANAAAMFTAMTVGDAKYASSVAKCVDQASFGGNRKAAADLVRPLWHLLARKSK